MTTATTSTEIRPYRVHVPQAELETYVKNYAETIAGNAPLTVGAVK